MKPRPSSYNINQEELCQPDYDRMFVSDAAIMLRNTAVSIGILIEDIC